MKHPKKNSSNPKSRKNRTNKYNKRKGSFGKKRDGDGDGDSRFKSSGYGKSGNKNRNKFKGKTEREPKNPEVPQIKDNPSVAELARQGMRLNKYLAHAGIASRRKADEIIKDGQVKVNDAVVTEMGYKVQKKDKVYYNNQLLSIEQKMYVLLNKPKNVITTTKDERGRKTVMELIQNASEERLYPVGRLDRNTTGLLLFTNDGELSQKLMHPSKEVRKLYHVYLNKPVTKRDLQQIQNGVKLEDGLATVDAVNWVEDARDEVGIQIHIGRNRIVRRIFEHLGYEVKKLDRVIFAGLTKKNLPRGRWRYLTEEEVIMIKHFKG